MIVSVNQTGVVTADASIEWWILAGGGLGIVIGLATWGYKVMQTIGENLAKVTPSRGFNIELASAITVVTGSKLGLPLSTTHCKVGAVVGVGLADGKAAVNWMLVLTVFGSWIVTLPIAGAVSAVFYLAMWYLVDYNIT
jgi:PiT family inorganic phosphate transporter